MTRLDAPGTIHHVITRGVDRRDIFVDDSDRRAYLLDLTAVLLDSGAIALAWALMPNHVHLVLRTGHVPLGRVMQRIGTRHARHVNTRHQRMGTLFQGRYRSILVDEEAYLLMLIRYVHRNPLRGGIVESIEELADHPWTGHSVLMGRRTAAFQATDEVLARFGATVEGSRGALVRWMADPADADVPPAASAPGEIQLRGDPVNECASAIGRIDFIGSAIDDLPECTPRRLWLREQWGLQDVIEYVCNALGVNSTPVRCGDRRHSAAAARAAIAYLARHELGIPCTEMSRHLGVSSSLLGRRLARGRDLASARGLTLRGKSSKVQPDLNRER
jgi:REP element-mobilizing transposase RayT